MLLGQAAGGTETTHEGAAPGGSKATKLVDELGRLKCACCGELKDITEFWRDAKAISGCNSSCKCCCKATRAKWSVKGAAKGAGCHKGIASQEDEAERRTWIRKAPKEAEKQFFEAVSDSLRCYGTSSDNLLETVALKQLLEQYIGMETASAIAQLAKLVEQEAALLKPNRQLLAFIGELKTMAELWVLPPPHCGGGRRQTSKLMAYWCFVLGALRLLLLTRLQLSTKSGREPALRRLEWQSSPRLSSILTLRHARASNTTFFAVRQMLSCWKTTD